MTSDERVAKKSDERLTTTADKTEDIRGRHEETIVDHSGSAVIQPSPVASRTEGDREPSRPVQPHAGGRADGALFDEAEIRRLLNRWSEIQSSFVDEPRRAVKDADGLVVEVTKQLADMFAKERTGLERQWDRGDNVTTEDLRVALKRYHTFFDRLLAV